VSRTRFKSSTFCLQVHTATVTPIYSVSIRRSVIADQLFKGRFDLYVFLSENCKTKLSTVVVCCQLGESKASREPDSSVLRWGAALQTFPSHWTMTLPIVRYSKKQKNTTFRKLDLFPSSGEPLRLALSYGPNWVGVSCPLTWGR
jgi:hypothetical protein